MHIELNEVGYCKVEALYSGNPEIVRSKRTEIIQELRNFKIPGFRKGKAPDHAIVAKLGRKLTVSVAEQMKAQAYDDVVFESESKPIGYPKFEDVKINGDNFSCKMTFIKKPSFELKSLKFDIPKPVVEIDVESAVQKTLQDLRVNLGDIRPFEENDVVESGDQITIGFNATIDEQPFDGSSVEGEMYVLGQNSFPEFDAELLGMKSSEQKVFEVIFPESFTDIGGKKAKFDLTVFMGAKKVPKALSDELATACGYESLDIFTQHLRNSYTTKLKQEFIMKVRQQVSLRLVNDYDFKSPDVLVDLEAQHLALMNQIIWQDLTDDEKKTFKNRAEQQVKLSLILDSIRETQPESVLSDIDAKNALISRANANGRDPKQFFEDATKNGSLVGLISSLRDEFTVQWVVDQANLIE